MKFLSTILLTVFATFLTGLTTVFISQDTVMYETHTLTPKIGEEAALDAKIAEHNRLYHADGPYMNYMFSILSGPRTGDLLFAMGACTFAQLDGRPASKAHDDDWAALLKHTEGGVKNVEYWVANEELSNRRNPTTTGEPKPLSRVRYFDVSDNSNFIDIQIQIKKTIMAMDEKRYWVMYRNRFKNKDGRDWALVTYYDSWAAFDEDNFDSFKSTFIKLYGADGWDKFDKKYEETVTSREDEMRVRRPDLQGDKKK